MPYCLYHYVYIIRPGAHYEFFVACTHYELMYDVLYWILVTECVYHLY